MTLFARLFCLVAIVSVAAVACRQAPDAAPIKELQKVKSGDVDVVLLAKGDALAQGKDSFVLEFRSADGSLRDVGTVRANATMAMAGMAPMFGTVDVKSADAPGRYEVTSDLGMAGTWQIKVGWQGGSATLSGAVR